MTAHFPYTPKQLRWLDALESGDYKQAISSSNGSALGNEYNQQHAPPPECGMPDTYFSPEILPEFERDEKDIDDD